MKVVCVLLSPGFPVQQLAESCLRFSPQIAVGDHWVFIEIGKCHRLYSEESLLLRLKALLSRFGLFAQMGIEADLPTALALARHRSTSKTYLPIKALADYFNPFQYSTALDKMGVQLNKLGIATLGEFLDLPPRTLLSRFGKTGLWVSQRIREADQIPWPYFKKEESICESLTLSVPDPNLESLLFHIKTLTDRVSARLLGRGEKVSVFQLSIQSEMYSHIRNPQRSFRFELPMAQSVGNHVLSIIRERLNFCFQREPLQSEVNHLRLEVIETLPLKDNQRDFLHKKDEEREKMGLLVARLEEKLGPQTVFEAQSAPHYLPERAWVALRKSDEISDSKMNRERFSLGVPLRPLRVLKKPLLLEEIYPKELNLKKSHRLGSERINEEWWFGGRTRDYHQVSTTEGTRLWIFERDEKFYLHGFYD